MGEGQERLNAVFIPQGYISNNDLAGQCWYGGARKIRLWFV